MTFLFWNHSIIGQHLFTSTQSASPQDWVLNCIYVYLFIHSLIRIFFYYLFVSLNLIYINQVWHFCLKSFKIHAHLLPLKVRHRNLNFELIYLNVYLDSCLFLGLNLIPIKHRHGTLVFFNLSEIHPRCVFLNSQHLSVVFAYGHTTLSTPDLVRSRKLSRVGPG